MKRIVLPIAWGIVVLWSGVLAFRPDVFMRAPEVVRDPLNSAGLAQAYQTRLRLPTRGSSDYLVLPPDSAVALLFVIDTCGACKMHMPVYDEIRDAVMARGIAYRVVVSYLDEIPSDFLDQLGKQHDQILLDRDHSFRQLVGVNSVPQVVIVNKDGTLNGVLAPGPRWAVDGEAFNLRRAIQ